jgi:redox-sensitive bicupin YhaK (pirin superfamily)
MRRPKDAHGTDAPGRCDIGLDARFAVHKAELLDRMHGVPTEGVGWWPHATPPAQVDNRSLVLFDRGDEVVVQGGDNGIRFLLVSGQPLKEPVAWYGPIVMNTQSELRQAFDELERGTFLTGHG